MTRVLVFTSPLEGEVAAWLCTRRVGGESDTNRLSDLQTALDRDHHYRKGAYPPPGGSAAPAAQSCLSPPTSPSRGEVKTKTLAALVALLLTTSPVFAASAAETLAAAEAAFAEGVSLRHDTANARPAFARAAAGYDVLWNQGFRGPELALNRSRAHRLAGNLPKAIAALHEGLAVARFARSLQAELEDARAAVPFPLDGELAAQCRPRPYTGVSTRMSVADAWFVAGGLWLLTCAGIVRLVMTRNAVWLVVAGLGTAALLTLGGLWVLDTRQRARDESQPLLIVSAEATLRRGNASAYPAVPKLDAPLPKGAEVRELRRRGGWVQVQLPGGAIGWLPETVVIDVEHAARVLLAK